MKAGAPALEAVTKAVSEVMTEQTQRVMIPRKVGLAMRDMYWNQHRFEKTAGKHPRYFLHRPGFSDAFEYLRFKSETTGEKSELRAWWKEFIKANPVTHAEAPREAKGPKELRGKGHARPSRRRRRGPRRGGGPHATKPKV
jgi:poly(A) polymerase